MYICGRCGKEVKNIEEGKFVRCPYCGYRIVYKTRAPLAREVSTD